VILTRGLTGETGFPPCYVRTRTYHAAMAPTHEAEELLLIEEADAWFEYLEATRGQTEPRYREVEPWAWARLSQRLRAVRTKRAKLRPAAEAA
jgi:hypothetical protein